MDFIKFDDDDDDDDDGDKGDEEDNKQNEEIQRFDGFKPSKQEQHPYKQDVPIRLYGAWQTYATTCDIQHNPIYKLVSNQPDYCTHDTVVWLFRCTSVVIFSNALFQSIEALYLDDQVGHAERVLGAICVPRGGPGTPESDHMFVACVSMATHMDHIFRLCVDHSGTPGVLKFIDVLFNLKPAETEDGGASTSASAAMSAMMGTSHELTTAEIVHNMLIHLDMDQESVVFRDRVFGDCVLGYLTEHLHDIPFIVLAESTFGCIARYTRFPRYIMEVVRFVCENIDDQMLESEKQDAICIATLEILSSPIDHRWTSASACCLFRTRCLTMLAHALCTSRYATIPGVFSTALSTWATTTTKTFNLPTSSAKTRDIARMQMPLIYKALFLSCDPQWVCWMLDALGSNSINTRCINCLHLAHYMEIRPMSWRHIMYIAIYTLASMRPIIRECDKDAFEWQLWSPPLATIGNQALSEQNVMSIAASYSATILEHIEKADPTIATSYVEQILDAIKTILTQIGARRPSANSGGTMWEDNLDCTNTATALLRLVGARYWPNKGQFLSDVLTDLTLHPVAVNWILTVFLSHSDLAVLTVAQLRLLLIRGGVNAVHTLFDSGTNQNILPLVISISVQTQGIDTTSRAAMARYVQSAMPETRADCLQYAHFSTTESGHIILESGPIVPRDTNRIHDALTRLWRHITRLWNRCWCWCCSPHFQSKFVQLDEL